MKEPYRKGSSESILASSLAGDIARCRPKRRQRYRWAGLLSFEKLAPAVFYDRVNPWRVCVLAVCSHRGNGRVSTRRPAEAISSFTRWDFVITLVAVVMVRLLVHGVRLTH